MGALNSAYLAVEETLPGFVVDGIPGAKNGEPRPGRDLAERLDDLKTPVFINLIWDETLRETRDGHQRRRSGASW